MIGPLQLHHIVLTELWKSLKAFYRNVQWRISAVSNPDKIQVVNFSFATCKLCDMKADVRTVGLVVKAVDALKFGEVRYCPFCGSSAIGRWVEFGKPVTNDC